MVGIAVIDWLLLYQCTVTLALLVFLAIALRNLWRFEIIHKLTQLPALQTFDKKPFVSLLVPARNEEQNIVPCVESLCQQDYADAEVIVLNDHSTDATGALLDELQREYPERLKIINGMDLPAGWIGKPWACHQLSLQARGDVLLFTDADTIHQPQMIISAIAFAERNKADFFSMIPYEVMETWSEQLVLPLIHYLYFAYLPNEWIMQTNNVKYSAANGQFMFFRRDTYKAIGGHQCVRNNLVEDVFLAKAVKAKGLRIALGNGIELMRCRMYANFSEVFAGFSKNFFAGMSYSLPMMFLFLTHFLLLFVLPIFFAGYAIVSGEHSLSLFWLPLAHYTMATLIRLMITKRFAMPVLQAFLHPIAVIIGMAIGVNSVRWAYSSRGTQWKGRQYSRAETEVG